MTVGSCPGCADLTVWTAAARTHQNASCTSCFATFHVAKCPGCAEVAAYVGTHAAAQFSGTSTGSPHTRSKEPGSATVSAQCSGLTCETCSLHFFECGCPACGAQASVQQLLSPIACHLVMEFDPCVSVCGGRRLGCAPCTCSHYSDWWRRKARQARAGMRRVLISFQVRH